MEEAKSVGVWIRVSTEDQARGESPEHHEKRARYYAESKGWTVKEVYHLEAVSGKSVMDHPETKRMLVDIRSQKITGIIFSKLARLARNTRELLDFADIFRECDADLVSLQESIDTSTPAGRLFYTMIAAMAQWEREEIAERVAASVPIRARLGKPVGGQAPYGYQWKDKKLILDPVEAPIRKRMHELFLEHKRKKMVAKLMDQSGFRTRNGGRFSDTTIERLLRDPIAKGLRRANYTKSLGHDKNWVMKPEKDWIFVESEPIISEEVWMACNSILDAQKSKKKPTKKTTHLFAGFVLCECGNKMYVPSMPSNRTPKYICQKCRNRIVATDLEEIFQNELKKFFFSPTEIQASLEEADKSLKEKGRLLETQQSEMVRIRTEMDRLIKLHMAGEIPQEGFGRHYQPLEKQLHQLESSIPELQGQIDFLKIQSYSSADVVAEAQDLYSRWSDFEPTEKRQIIENITDNIIIGSNEISINLSYKPTSSELVDKRQRNVMDSSRKQA